MMRKFNLADIVSQNTKRLEELFRLYDPAIGTPGVIERRLLEFEYVDQKYTYFLPKAMFRYPFIQDLERHKRAEVAGYLNDLDPEELFEKFIRTRLKHDFEFHCITCVKIKPKEDDKLKAPTQKELIKDNLVPFKLNRAQRKLLKKIEGMRLKKIPIRVILLKARQWGGSTMIQQYIFWLQLYHLPKSNSAIVADQEGQSRNIRGMISRTVKNFPKALDHIELSPYEGDPKTKVINISESIIAIGSIQRPDALRSFDWSLLHLSEVGLWKETQGKKPEDLAQSMKSAVLNSPGTMIVEESTAKGVGNYFHRQWLSTKNKGGYTGVFIAWHDIELYVEQVKEGYEKFLSTWTDKHWYLWDMGATIEGIKWYFNFKTRENYDEWRMESEFPTTADEAFQSTGRRVFAPQYVKKARVNCKDPLFIGDLYAKASSGPDCLTDINFQQNSTGNMKIWKMPGHTNGEKPIQNRYAAFADIGGRTDKADYSELVILDRKMMQFGLAPEVVASYTCHIDQDLFAWKCAQICQWYEEALLGVESNSLHKEDTDGDHALTVLDTIADHYKNLYTRTNPEDIREGLPTKYGFHTNSKSKGMIIDSLNAGLREDGYVERDIFACDQMDTYEVKANGTLGAVDGCKDDKVIVRAGAYWLATSYMDSPIHKEVDRVRNKYRSALPINTWFARYGFPCWVLMGIYLPTSSSNTKHGYYSF